MELIFVCIKRMYYDGLARESSLKVPLGIIIYGEIQPDLLLHSSGRGEFITSSSFCSDLRTVLEVSGQGQMVKVKGQKLRPRRPTTIWPTKMLFVSHNPS